MIKTLLVNFCLSHCHRKICQAALLLLLNKQEKTRLEYILVTIKTQRNWKDNQ